jgi:hypothetical protein
MNTKTSHTSPADTTQAVEALLKSLVHPMKAEIQMIREAILAADPAIKEGVKWNAPSYRTVEYFATTNLREKQGIGIILHLGAKVRDLKPGELKVEDPTGMLTWLAKDRAMIKFANGSDFQAKKGTFTALVRSWVRHV